mmetsp:Transcript_41272/g.81448  ORF Transcript_41272/g.81448 Transcript_41272/m.81448 type:complete len:491 (+) Transcript_41272:34-1506(+)
MEVLVGDVRYVSLPCILAASVLQYMRFAKKPMAAPCHWLSERLARRCVLIGLGAELVGLGLLPLCEAYPMNASCLVFLYFWKESKRSRAARCCELLACASALSAWALPFLSQADAKVPAAVRIEAVVDKLMAPATCIYVTGLLLTSIVLHCLCHGRSALGSCTPPGLNFGVSAMLLKALMLVVIPVTMEPARSELWAAMACIVVLLLGVRSAAAMPLRRALEVHDNLSVLAAYGLVSSIVASVTGGLVFGEMDSWDPSQQTCYLIVAAAHCWGMSTLGRASSDVKAIKDGADTDVERGTETPAKGLYGKSLQMTELSSRGSTATPSAIASRREEPSSPLLNFNEPSVHTVDDDVEFEEKIFAHALAPLHLSPAKSDGSAADPWTAAWPDSGNSATAPSSTVAAAAPTAVVPQFDADFEEMMRRFGEEDSDKGQRITDLAPEPVLERPAVPDAAFPPSVLTYDAQTMLDDACGAQDDEDELLRSIEDIPAP